MARQKLKRFSEAKEFESIIEPEKSTYDNLRGNWRGNIFDNDNEIILEIACGRGEYTVGLATYFPNKNFIGIDIKGDRILHGAKIAYENQIENVAFLRITANELEDFFEENEVHEIWIIHPDPRPKKKHEHKRLTNQRFLDIYKKISCENALMRLKTDNRQFFEYSLKTLEKNKIKDFEYTFDLDKSLLLADHYNIETRYELKFKALGYPINYLKFRFND
jgi:tRNA (guanine-N7-)-methyltransferase